MLRWIKTSRDRRTRNERSSQSATNQSQLSQSKPRVWLPTLVFFGSILFIVVLALLEVKVNPFQVSVRRTGFGQSYSNDVSTVIERATETTGTTTKTIDKTTTTTTKKLQPAKTLWDLMPLLLAPATLVYLGYLFQSSQERAKQDQEAADKARSADQQREESLQTYFNQLSELLVDKQLKKLLGAKESETSSAAEKTNTATSIDAEAALNVVRAKTLTLLRMFDQDIPRKASVLSFLADAGLLQQLKLDLSGISLKYANLKKVNFSSCNLQYADLSFTDLKLANLNLAYLYNVNFESAFLPSVDLGSSDLSKSTLSGAILVTAKLCRANLSHADLSNADLTETDLSRANLSNAKLIKVNLNGVFLSHANLLGAKFWNSELKGIKLDRAKKEAIASIKSARNWQSARYDPEIRELLNLPLEGSKAKANDNAPPEI